MVKLRREKKKEKKKPEEERLCGGASGANSQPCASRSKRQTSVAQSSQPAATYSAKAGVKRKAAPPKGNKKVGLDQDVFSLWKDQVGGIFMAHPWSKARRATRFRFHSVQYQRGSTTSKAENEWKIGLLSAPKPFKVGIVSEEKKASQAGSSTHTGQMSRSAKIAAIKNKLKSLEEEENCCLKKKPRQGDSVT
ncbi:hypothetical protein C5167_048212 [Papaver somniferum]|uniref:Uncharacterized protein n=1 Tax=Papaver somniferum TaxID=3469 RepID=A0A4Y7KK70_PAPSO|nr:hypothetical protein C5167_048212 [Papaver somniferum]